MKHILLALLLLPILALGDPDNECTGNPHHCNNGDSDRNTIEIENETKNILNSDNSATSDSSGGSSTVETNNESSFFAFSTSFPNASGCMAGGQGGLKDGDVAGFLGFHRMDTNCWLDALAEAETNVDMRARLKCGASKFRKAIAYDQPRKEQQAYCISYVKVRWLAEIERERDAAKECEINDVCAYVNGELHHYQD